MSLEVEAYCNGMPVSVEWLRLNENEIKDLVRDIIMKGALETVQIAKSIVPVKTGRLRDSIVAYERVDGASVLASAPYAIYVEAKRHFLAEAARQVIPSIAAEIEDCIDQYFRGEML
jgi:hypothetical protein